MQVCLSEQHCNPSTTYQWVMPASIMTSIAAGMLPYPCGVPMQIAAQLSQAVQHSGPQEGKLATAQLCAAALIAVQPDSFSYSSSGLRILRAMARAPLRRLTPETMRLSQFCWCWVCALLCPSSVLLYASPVRCWWVLFQNVCELCHPWTNITLQSTHRLCMPRAFVRALHGITACQR